ncbi:MAG: DUF1640 domain-containing protein [Xylella fastidiosa subsp. multiplex]
MTSVTFDTLKFANRLKAAGVPAAHAEAEAEALAGVLEINLQGLGESESKNGKALVRLEANIKEGVAQVDQSFAQVDQRFEKIDQRFIKAETFLAEMKGQLLLLKWMFGVIVTSLIALVIKVFF